MEARLSVSHSDLSVLEDSVLTARAEAGSIGFSDTVLKALKERDLRHGEGNLQLKIASYMPDAQTNPLRARRLIDFILH